MKKKNRPETLHACGIFNGNHPAVPAGLVEVKRWMYVGMLLHHARDAAAGGNK